MGKLWNPHGTTGVQALRGLAKEVNLKVFAHGDSLLTTGPTDTQQFLVQFAKANAVFATASSDALVTFPKPFPNGIAIIVANHAALAGSAYPLTIAAPTVSNFYLDNNHGLTGTFVVNYIAIGW